MSSERVIETECPICMDPIDGLYNRVVTECGHAFHCLCLMQNTAHNGFSCPYCRNKLADEPVDSEDEDEDEYEDETVFEDDALTSFRMFHEQLDGEEVEEEPVVELEELEEEEEDTARIPDASYITEKLTERGVTMEDLVKNILFLEQNNWGGYFDKYERMSSEIFGQFRIVMSQYARNNA